MKVLLNLIKDKSPLEAIEFLSHTSKSYSYQAMDLLEFDPELIRQISSVVLDSNSLVVKKVEALAGGVIEKYQTRVIVDYFKFLEDIRKAFSETKINYAHLLNSIRDNDIKNINYYLSMLHISAVKIEVSKKSFFKVINDKTLLLKNGENEHLIAIIKAA